MKPNFPQLSFAVALAGLLAACSTTKSAASAETPKEQPAAAPAPAPEPAPAAAPAPAPAPILVKAQPLFFDFDQYQLQPAGQEFLSSFGALLAKHPELKVRLEGNCDERGTTAYNMALGAKRAEAAKAYLVQMGAREEQITTVSYGKERPLAKGHDEKAWSQNRRDDVVPSQESVTENP